MPERATREGVAEGGGDERHGDGGGTGEDQQRDHALGHTRDGTHQENPYSRRPTQSVHHPDAEGGERRSPQRLDMPVYVFSRMLRMWRVLVDMRVRVLHAVVNVGVNVEVAPPPAE